MVTTELRPSPHVPVAVTVARALAEPSRETQSFLNTSGSVHVREFPETVRPRETSVLMTVPALSMKVTEPAPATSTVSSGSGTRT